jgi:hypothetical protein
MGTPSTARSSGDQQWCDGRNSLAVARVGARRVRGVHGCEKGEAKGSITSFIGRGWEQKGSGGGNGRRPAINGHDRRL